MSARDDGGPPRPRRLLALLISDELIARAITPGSKVPSFEVTEGFPADARLVEARFDFDGRHVRFVFEHESFPEVPWGHLIPARAVSARSLNTDLYGEVRALLAADLEPIAYERAKGDPESDALYQQVLRVKALVQP